MGLFQKKEKEIIIDNVLHIAGLNVPDNCKGAVNISNEKLTMRFAGQVLSLNISQINNIDCQMDIDINQYQKSSIAKGIVGAAAFGVAGAIIGSTPKTKEKREVKCYAIISYTNSIGVSDTIVLGDAISNTANCAKLTDKLNPIIKQQIKYTNL